MKYAIYYPPHGGFLTAMLTGGGITSASTACFLDVGKATWTWDIHDLCYKDLIRIQNSINSNKFLNAEEVMKDSYFVPISDDYNQADFLRALTYQEVFDIVDEKYENFDG